MRDLELPNQVNELLNRLNAYTYNAYIVGKCVRELLKDQGAVDFDVITNATVDRICAIFDNYSVNSDNIRQGEIIVTIVGMPILVSTYRSGFDKDGLPIYTDNLIDDLRRRDFSMNAIAYNPREGFIDPFGGIDCLLSEQGLVDVIDSENELRNDDDRTYLSPEKAGYVSPFLRDPVTILQALGYYSTGDYLISPYTRELILRHKNNVTKISQNDLRTELSWVLRGKKVSAVLEEYSDVFTTLIPEFEQLIGFDQKSDEHEYDALTHTYKSVGYASPVLTLRYAMFFHALGKPDCISVDKEGKGHFYGYEERSRIYAQRIMQRLGFTDDEIKKVGFLVKNHKMDISADKRSLKLKLREIPSERLKLLLQFKYADIKAKSPEFESVAMHCKRQVDAINEIVAMKECYSVQQLAVNRYDLLQKGIVKNNEQAAIMLEKLLEVVIDSPAFNTRSRLLSIAEKAAQNAHS